MLLLCDVLIAVVLGTSGKYWKYTRWMGRPLRPFVVLSHQPPLENELFKLLRTMPVAMDVAVLIAFMLAVFALIMSRIFEGGTVSTFE